MKKNWLTASRSVGPRMKPDWIPGAPTETYKLAAIGRTVWERSFQLTKRWPAALHIDTTCLELHNLRVVVLASPGTSRVETGREALVAAFFARSG